MHRPILAALSGRPGTSGTPQSRTGTAVQIKQFGAALDGAHSDRGCASLNQAATGTPATAQAVTFHSRLGQSTGSWQLADLAGHVRGGAAW
jgi:hypothetical protein